MMPDPDSSVNNHRERNSDHNELSNRLVEKHSIDRVPDGERGGRLSNLGAVWFVGSINLTIIATGIVAASVGASLFWTLVALVAGTLFGTFFMAFHSAQGPQLGIPQLIQSRPQFGYIGAAISVFIFALANYLVYNIADAIIVGSAGHEIVGLAPSLGFPLAVVFAAVLAILGYHWIHRVNRILTIPSIILMVVLSVAVVTNHHLPPGVWLPGQFSLAPVMTVFIIAAGGQLLWSPYVSDYSRYLPSSVSVRSTFLWTYIPCALGALWVFSIGAIAAAAVPSGTSPIVALKTAADALFNGFGNIAIVGLLIGLLVVMALNAYGGSLAMISIVDSFHPVKPTRIVRIIAITIMSLIVWFISQFIGEEGFAAYYQNALIFLAYIFTPWTAINLVDFFFVRKGVYVISEIFNPRGATYGRWSWRGLSAYLIGLASMTPFFVTGPFTGAVAQNFLGSVDYSIFVGLPVSGGVYYVLCRGMDLSSEMRLARLEGLVNLHHIADRLPDETENPGD